ncbi:putative alkaline protease protein [Eutypa lata UCREL1]|uniref:Putative alkaline protease protein n=1 Tax=Eutypa lata (strain UCR-EL1) TaxID=1287681 RepID=M7T2W1_EUTLA|nr:putative alkaline protease protein [Eutypa lata UCREL1]
MRVITLLFSYMVAVALAKAPLVNRDPQKSRANSYIVVLKKDIDADSISEHLSYVRAAASNKLFGSHRGLVKTYSINAFNGYHVECDQEMLEEIRNNHMVDYVSQDSVIKTLSPIPKEAVHDESLEFGGRARWGATFVDEDVDEDLDFDEGGHGTHVAAIVAGNTVGVDNHTIPIAVKVMGRNSLWSGVIKGIEWGSDKSDAGNDAIKNAVQAGMTVVVAAGNEDHNACDLSPAGVMEAITVGSIDQDDTRATGSSWGECLDLFAPGVGVYTGLITYLMSRESTLTTPAQVKDRIKELATKNKVKDPLWSPNLIAFNGNAGGL